MAAKRYRAHGSSSARRLSLQWKAGELFNLPPKSKQIQGWILVSPCLISASSTLHPSSSSFSVQAASWIPYARELLAEPTENTARQALF